MLKDDVKNYRQAWLDAGHPGDPSVAIRINTHVSATQREADQVREVSERMQADRLAKRGRSLKQERPADVPKRSSDLFGTAEEIVDRIHQLREDFGADEIICTMLGTKSDREDDLNSIRLISEKVIPEVSSR